MYNSAGLLPPVCFRSDVSIYAVSLLDNESRADNRSLTCEAIWSCWWREGGQSERCWIEVSNPPLLPYAHLLTRTHWGQVCAGLNQQLEPPERFCGTEDRSLCLSVVLTRGAFKIYYITKYHIDKMIYFSKTKYCDMDVKCWRFLLL